MPKLKVPNHLTGGEISRALDTNTKYVRRSDSVLRARNFTINPQGGVDKRPGLERVASLNFNYNDSNRTATRKPATEGGNNVYERLIPWERTGNAANIIALTKEGDNNKILGAVPQPQPVGLSVADIEGKYVADTAKKTRSISLSAGSETGALNVLLNGDSIPYHVEAISGSQIAAREVILLPKVADDRQGVYKNYGTATFPNDNVFPNNTGELIEQPITLDTTNWETNGDGSTTLSVEPLISRLDIQRETPTSTIYGFNNPTYGSLTNRERTIGEATTTYNINTFNVNTSGERLTVTLSTALPNGFDYVVVKFRKITNVHGQNPSVYRLDRDENVAESGTTVKRSVENGVITIKIPATNVTSFTHTMMHEDTHSFIHAWEMRSIDLTDATINPDNITLEELKPTVQFVPSEASFMEVNRPMQTGDYVTATRPATAVSVNHNATAGPTNNWTGRRFYARGMINTIQTTTATYANSNFGYNSNSFGVDFYVGTYGGRTNSITVRLPNAVSFRYGETVNFTNGSNSWSVFIPAGTVNGAEISVGLLPPQWLTNSDPVSFSFTQNPTFHVRTTDNHQTANNLGVVEKDITVNRVSIPSAANQRRVTITYTGNIASRRFRLKYTANTRENVIVFNRASATHDLTELQSNDLRAATSVTISVLNGYDAPELANGKFVALGAERTAPNTYRTVMIVGKEFYIRNEDVTLGIERLPYEDNRRVVALYVNNIIELNTHEYLDAYTRDVLPLVRAGTHNETSLKTALSDLGVFKVEEATITHPPLVGPLTNAEYARGQNRVGEDYCINIGTVSVAFLGRDPNALDLDLDQPKFRTPITDMNDVDYNGGRLDTLSKIAAEKELQKVKMRQEPANTSEVFMYEGQYCCAWNPIDGFPLAGSKWDTRFALAGVRALPGKIWFSVQNRFFDFIQISRNLSQNISGRTIIRETDGVTPSFYGLEYEIDAGDAIQLIYPSNVLCVFGEETESTFSGWIDANNPTRLDCQKFDRFGTRGNAGITEIDKKLFKWNGFAPIAMKHVNDQSGYTMIDLSKYNQDLFKIVDRFIVHGGEELPLDRFSKTYQKGLAKYSIVDINIDGTVAVSEYGDESIVNNLTRNTDNVIRVCGGAMRDLPSIYQVFYCTENGNIKVFHTMENADEDFNFFAWSSWDMFTEPEFDVGTDPAGGVKRKMVDAVHIKGRLFILDNKGDVWYFNPKITADKDCFNEDIDVEMDLITSGFASQDLGGGLGYTSPKKIEQIGFISSEFSMNLSTDPNPEVKSNEDAEEIYAPRVRILPMQPDFAKIEMDTQIGTFPPRKNIIRTVNGTEMAVSSGYRRILNPDNFPTEQGFIETPSIQVKHRNKGPFNISRLEIIFDAEAE